MFGVLINGLLGFGMVVSVLFTLKTVDDIAAILTPTTGVVFIDYFNQALGDARFATGLSSFLLVLFIFAAIAILASASRVTWSMARDGGIPGSSWLKKVSPTLRLPLNAIFLSAIVSLLLSLINIGSSVAFNAIVSLVVATLFGSYVIPIALIAWTRATNKSFHFGPWKLGKLGLAVNLLALGWLIITFIFSFFPVAVPVVPSSMNWSILLYGFAMLFGVIWYFVFLREKFEGPVLVDSMTIR